MLKSQIKNIMMAIDKTTVKASGFRTVSGSQTKSVYFHLQKYKGPDKHLFDGEVIKSGDTVAELHLNNKVMSDMGALSLRQTISLFNEELALLGKEVKDDFGEVKAIYGRSQLYAILKRLGFEIHEIDGKSMQIFLSYWDSVYKWAFSAGKNNTFKRRQAKEVWMSRVALMDKSI